MRIGKRGFAARIKGNLKVAFGDEKLSSHAGLELVRRYLREGGFFAQLRTSEQRLPRRGDLRFGSLVLLLVAMLLVGGRRLRHVEYLGRDPLVERIAGLRRLPSRRTLARRLAALRKADMDELDRLVLASATDPIRPLALSRLTIDVDGSVLTTGLTVAGAERGYNPHHRKNPSYYPILATLAQTGAAIADRNRPGNIHDSHRAGDFLKATVTRLRETLPAVETIEVRADSAFFQRDFLQACDRLGVEYAVKVPMWPYLNLRTLVRKVDPGLWRSVNRAAQVQGIFLHLEVPFWKRAEHIAIYRTRRSHKPVKGTQLDLFNPDDGYWEYSVVATNKDLDLAPLWHFINGHGVHEKTLAELKSGFAYDQIPTRDLRANTAWQKLNLLAHNINVGLQVETMPRPKRRTHKRTASFIINSIRTVRFEWLNRAARLIAPGGTSVLRLATNPAVQHAFNRVEHALDQAA
ncbi:MAG: IS1380 family transposase [Pseudomonadota bacterium]